jgi:hypothetical protein
LAVVRIQALSLLKARVQSLVGETKNLKPGHPPPPKKKSEKSEGSNKGQYKREGGGVVRSPRGRWEGES